MKLMGAMNASIAFTVLASCETRCDPTTTIPSHEAVAAPTRAAASSATASVTALSTYGTISSTGTL